MFKKWYTFILQRLSPNQYDWLRSFRRFTIFRKKKPAQQLFIFFADGSSFHGGLTDRLKGIVSTFLFCLQNHIAFRIYHTYPFSLSDYLMPNTYNWQLANNEVISYNIFEAKYMFLIGDPSARRLKKLHTKKQIHCFANRDITAELLETGEPKYEWGDLFKMLFKPTQELRITIEKHQSNIGGAYISAVFRFQNLLGDFTEYNVESLSDKEKKNLITKCKSSLLQLQKSLNEERILVTSDSALFLEALAGLPNIFAFPSKVVHIDNTINEAHEVYMKSFIDLYLLSEGKAIYSIGTDEMYKTEFPLYAAKINNIPFQRILIK